MSNTAITGATYDLPPMPDDAWEIQRWEHTRLRRRMLTGQWSDDLRRYLASALGGVSADEIGGFVDISGNLFASVCSTLSTLYTVAPVVIHGNDEAAKRMSAILDAAGFASTMSGIQRMTLGLREMLMHVDVYATGDEASPVEVSLRPVYPDLVVASPHPRKPWEPIAIREARQVIDPVAGGCVWAWMEASKEPNDPRATLPYVMYHAEYGATLWEPRAWSELVEGTLSAATNRSSANHNLRFASFVQRILIDASLASDEVNGRAKIVTTAATVLQLRSDEGKQAQVQEWGQPFSPSEFTDAIERSENTMALMSGIPAADVLRSNSDSRSGVSLQIGREGKREAARRFEPTFRRADLMLICTIATLVNDELGFDYLPESGWSIDYQSQPATADELNAEQDRILGLLDRGLISRFEARAQLYGETIAEARVALAKISSGSE